MGWDGSQEAGGKNLTASSGVVESWSALDEERRAFAFTSRERCQCIVSIQVEQASLPLQSGAVV
jgi:hypothetical protein